MTLEQLAAVVGITSVNLSFIERGIHKAQRGTRHKIEEVIGRVDWLADYHPKKTKIFSAREVEDVGFLFLDAVGGLQGIKGSEKKEFLFTLINSLTKAVHKEIALDAVSEQKGQKSYAELADWLENGLKLQTEKTETNEAANDKK